VPEVVSRKVYYTIIENLPGGWLLGFSLGNIVEHRWIFKPD
jgi:hypothetical protein